MAGDQNGCKRIVAVTQIMSSMSHHFNNPDMSDLELHVGNQTYYVHKFVLGIMSDVFRTMCSRRWDGDRNVLKLQECEECLPVFEDFLLFFYSGNVEINVSTALPFLMLADKYNVRPLREGLVEFMKVTVTEGSITGALQWLAYAQVSDHSALQTSCVNVIVTKLDEVVASDDFLGSSFDFLTELLERDDLVVQWEKSVYDALLRWVMVHDMSSDEIMILMKLIRFPMMTPEQLYEIETSAFFDKHKDIMSPIINHAHRFRSIGTEVYDMITFSHPIFRPRNYTHRLWCHFMTVDTNGDSFFQNSIGVRCVNHPVVATPEQFWQIKILGEKRCSRNISPNKPVIISHPAGHSTNYSAVKTIPLVMTITPLRPIKQDVIVDVSLYQVKRDKISKHLCNAAVKFTADEYLSYGMTRRKNGSNHYPQGPSNGTEPPKFSPSPMNFSIMFHQAQTFDKPEVSLQCDFAMQDFDHPAEIPCFKLNGPARMTNSVRVAVIFKPRFAVYQPVDEQADEDISGKPPAERICNTGCLVSEISSLTESDNED